MKVMPDNELRAICNEFLDADRTAQEWAEVESDDMFQTTNYSGGFDADKNAFCFSRYSASGEVWFPLTLAQVRGLAGGQHRDIDARPAE